MFVAPRVQGGEGVPSALGGGAALRVGQIGTLWHTSAYRPELNSSLRHTLSNSPLSCVARV